MVPSLVSPGSGALGAGGGDHPEPSRRARDLAIAYAAIAAVWFVDFASGIAFDVSLSYVFPVAFTTWRVSRRAGAATAVVSAVIDTLLDVHLGRYLAAPSPILWNLAVQFGLLMAGVWFVDRLRATTRSEAGLLVRLGDAHRRLELTYGALELEVEGVAAIQRSLLPPAAPSLPGYELAVHYASSARAGGDYYDFLPLPDGRLALLVADVSGHGPPAAVIMAMARVLVHGDRATHASPERLLFALNEGLAENILLGHFVTACAIVLDPATGGADFALAGHPSPVVVRARTELASEVGEHDGPPLGLGPVAGYRRQSVALEPGDALVVYTDGLTEARSPAGEMLEEAGVLSALTGGAELPASGLLGRLLDRMCEQLDGARNDDDVTIVDVRRTRPPIASPA